MTVNVYRLSLLVDALSGRTGDLRVAFEYAKNEEAFTKEVAAWLDEGEQPSAELRRKATASDQAGDDAPQVGGAVRSKEEIAAAADFFDNPEPALVRVSDVVDVSVTPTPLPEALKSVGRLCEVCGKPIAAGRNGKTCSTFCRSSLMSEITKKRGAGYAENAPEPEASAPEPKEKIDRAVAEPDDPSPDASLSIINTRPAGLDASIPGPPGQQREEMWPEDKIEELRRLRTEYGFTFLEIAARLGPDYTKSMVIGKAQRLGLVTKPAEAPTAAPAKASPFKIGDLPAARKLADPARKAATKYPSFAAETPVKRPDTIYDVMAWRQRQGDTVKEQVGGLFVINGGPPIDVVTFVERSNSMRRAAKVPVFVIDFTKIEPAKPDQSPKSKTAWFDSVSKGAGQ